MSSICYFGLAVTFKPFAGMPTESDEAALGRFQAGERAIAPLIPGPGEAGW
jgi:hypothetical protein